MAISQAGNISQVGRILFEGQLAVKLDPNLGSGGRGPIRSRTHNRDLGFECRYE